MAVGSSRARAGGVRRGRRRRRIDDLGGRAAVAGLVGAILTLTVYVLISSYSTTQVSTAVSSHHRVAAAVQQAQVAALYEVLTIGADDTVTAGDLARFDRLAGALENDLRTAAAAGTSGRLAGQLATAATQHARVRAAVRTLADAPVGEDAAARQQFWSVSGELSRTLDRLATRQRASSARTVAQLSASGKRFAVATPLVVILCAATVVLSALRIRRYRQRIEHQALHDALTGLPNRRLLRERMEQALSIAGRTGSSTALLLIDLDRFKEINDTLGHLYGDLVLTEIGPRLQAKLRESDTVARLGGDEFAVLLTNLPDAASAVAVAHSISEAIGEPIRAGQLTLDVEASIGVAVCPDHGTTADELVQRADVAMYVAKASHTGVAVYEASDDRHSPERLALLGELRHAVDHGELVIHYQPKNALSDGAVHGVEALVRWQHPQRGLLGPGEFIPLIEHTSLIEPLTSWVLGAAVGQVRQWLDDGIHLPVAINVSARSLSMLTFADELRSLIAAAAIPPELIELEVTETAIMREPERTREVMQTLAALGVRLSIDDFGIGYTSLSALRTLPVDALKIDRSFVSSMRVDEGNAVIVRSVIELAHNLGLAVVAEGIEDAETCCELAAAGCSLGQGYYWTRPLPIAAFDAWLADQLRTGREVGLPVVQR